MKLFEPICASPECRNVVMEDGMWCLDHTEPPNIFEIAAASERQFQAKVQEVLDEKHKTNGEAAGADEDVQQSEQYRNAIKDNCVDEYVAGLLDYIKSRGHEENCTRPYCCNCIEHESKPCSCGYDKITGWKSKVKHGTYD